MTQTLTVAATALDQHAAHLPALLAAIHADPTGPVARQVRDDLRRAHPRGVARNRNAVGHLVAALPETMRAGLLSTRCRNRGTYLSID